MAKTANKPKLTERPTGTQKRLTITERLIIYAEKGTGSSALTIADRYGVAKSTVQVIWKNTKLDDMKQQVSLVKETMADECLLVAHACVGQVGTAIHKASAKDAAIAAGILIEKHRLLTDQSTANVNNAHAFLDTINSVEV